MVLLLGLWDRRWQIASSYCIGEVLALVRTVAEGLVARMAAAAEGNCRATGQAESVTLLVFHFEIAFYFDRAVIKDRYFSCWQGILRC